MLFIIVLRLEYVIYNVYFSTIIILNKLVEKIYEAVDYNKLLKWLY